MCKFGRRRTYVHYMTILWDLYEKSGLCSHHACTTPTDIINRWEMVRDRCKNKKLSHPRPQIWFHDHLMTPAICGSTLCVTISCGDDPSSDLRNNLTIGTSCEDMSTTMAIRAGSGAASPGTVIYIECNIDPYQAD